MPGGVDTRCIWLRRVTLSRPGLRRFAMIPSGGRSRSSACAPGCSWPTCRSACCWCSPMSSVGVYGIVLAGWSSGSPYSLLGVAALGRAGDQLRDRDGAGLRGRVPVRGLAVHRRDRQCPAARVVRVAAADLVRDLPGHDGRRDQPAAVRPARGRGRAGGRVPHRVLVDEVRAVLPGRVHQHGHGLRAGDDPVPRRRRAPWPLSLWSGANSGWWPLLWFLAKVFIFLFCFIWLRGTLPRVRYDQLMAIGWKMLIPVSLVWILLIATVRRGAPERRSTAVYIIAGVIVALLLLLAWRGDVAAERRRTEREQEAPAPAPLRGRRPGGLGEPAGRRRLPGAAAGPAPLPRGRRRRPHRRLAPR